MGEEYTIVVDTREQKPLWKNSTKTQPIIVYKLDTGDYSIKGYAEKIAIEYKSPNDIFSTLSAGHDRFKRELERAKDLDFFAIVISADYLKIRDKCFEGAQHITKMPGSTITKILSTLAVKYGVKVYFAVDRREAKALIKCLLDAYHRNFIQGVVV